MRFRELRTVGGCTMTTGLSGIDDLHPAEGEDACVAGASTAEVLRLLSAGATGAILMALGEGPLRTKTLTEQVPGYAPRTIYRYAGKLAELEVVEREEEPGVPSKVVHTLSDPCGTELYELVNRFADASLTRLPDGRIDAHAWASLGLLADLWEAGMVEELACEGRSPTELAQGDHGLSYHQVNRRAGLFKASGLLSEWQGVGRRRCYGLTEKTRRKMGLLEVRDEEDAAGAGGEEVAAEVEGDGSIHSCVSPPADAVAWGRGKVESWIPVILDGKADKVLVGGEEGLIADCLDRLYETLWSPAPF